MRKIPTIFARDFVGNPSLVLDSPTEEAAWVFAGEGTATRKFDGTACLVHSGRLHKRYDAKRGKVPPVAFVPAQQEPDEKTGHWPGWLPVSSVPEDKWHREAEDAELSDGTYELCGPKVQGNPEGFGSHVLVRHGAEPLWDAPRTFDELKVFFESKRDIEGVVWHHEDGRMAKIKARDFGLRRRAAE